MPIPSCYGDYSSTSRRIHTWCCHQVRTGQTGGCPKHNRKRDIGALLDPLYAPESAGQAGHFKRGPFNAFHITDSQGLAWEVWAWEVHAARRWCSHICRCADLVDCWDRNCGCREGRHYVYPCDLRRWSVRHGLLKRLSTPRSEAPWQKLLSWLAKWTKQLVGLSPSWRSVFPRTIEEK